ncbi:CapA family protein [Leptospira sp. GIMC2001]|uniref:CapA family protein n=1 Tax=Leptospira sp. GIMC2001 TaxID=1513297 RepID=UPI002349D888|nr:CapA family protein [Leptospira sp. GIMC2001]WCL48315.1 CapA family protein [Leptospira sp. GIMC2001]
MKQRIVFIIFASFFLVYSYFTTTGEIAAIEPREQKEIVSKKIDPNEIIIRTKRGVRLNFPKTTKLLFAGDTMFNWGVKETIDRDGYELPFEEWKQIFRRADLRFLNLETPILKDTNVGTKDKSFVFYGAKEDVNLLKFLDLNAVFLGNNHSMDFERDGLSDTLKLLNDSNIVSLGAGFTEAQAFEPKLFTAKGNDFLLYSVSEVGDRHLFARGNSPGIAYFYEAKIASEVRRNRARLRNINPILSLHWGWEYNPEPTIGQRRSAQKMIDAGFGAVVGHHPHIPQGIEIYKGKPIIYSLGNFIFGSKNNYLNHNIVVILHYLKNKLVALELIPSFGKFQNRGHDFYPLDPIDAEEFLEEYAILCEKLGTKIQIQGGRGYIFLDKTIMSKL